MVKIEAGSLVLHGKISAAGSRGSSGGSINIKIAGGAVIDNDVELQREACRVLANLAANFSSQPAIFEVAAHMYNTISNA